MMLWLGIARSAAAEPSAIQTVVIVDPDETPIARRLEQEIEALGFVVRIEREAAEGDAAEKLSEDAIVASIHVRAARPGRLNLVILDPKTHDLVRAELAIEAPRDPAAAELAAARTAELLRAVRLSVPASQPPSAKPTKKPELPAIRPETPRAERPHDVGSVAVTGGPALVAVPNWSPGVAALADAALFTAAGLGLDAQAVFPLTPARVESDGGSIEAYCSSYRLAAAFEWRLATPLRARWALGGELDRMMFRGVVAAPLLAREDRSTTFGLWTMGSLSLQLSRHLAVTSSVSGSWDTRRTAVRYAGQVVRDWGRPMLVASLGVAWSSR